MTDTDWSIWTPLLKEQIKDVNNLIAFEMYFGRSPNKEEREWFKTVHLSYDNKTFRSNKLFKNPFYKFRMWVWRKWGI